MCITEEKLVDRYGESNPHERFMLIYKNYEVFLRLVESYETGLFNRILYEREYNLRAKNGEDLGIRIQTNRISDPTNEIRQGVRQVKSTVTGNQSRYLRPIYDQIREHVQKHLLISQRVFLGYKINKAVEIFS